MPNQLELHPVCSLALDGENAVSSQEFTSALDFVVQGLEDEGLALDELSPAFRYCAYFGVRSLMRGRSDPVALLEGAELCHAWGFLIGAACAAARLR